MKNLIFATLLCLSLLHQIHAVTQSIDTLSPRQPTSCPNEEGDYSWYFDGQKCENCSSEGCKCTAYNECTECQSGYGMYTDSTGKKYCRKCGIDGITSCCFIPTQDDKILMRALKCKKTLSEDAEANYILYGSVCYNIPYCQDYTDYGTCKTCKLGYYRNEDGGCTKCDKLVCIPDGNKEICLSEEQIECKECGGPYNCTKCEEGYFLSKYTKVNGHREGSICYKCSGPNCKCTTADTVCTGCLSTNLDMGYFQDLTSTPNKCLKCDIPNCNKCTSSDTCQSCDPKYILKDNKCIECYAAYNCIECELNKDSGAVQCKQGQCHNGYFQEEDDFVCKDCRTKIPDYVRARCENGKIHVLTQCEQVISSSTQTLTRAPHAGSFYLVKKKNDTAKQCEKNIHNCKTMRDDKDAQDKSLCNSCYDDMGYHLVENDRCLQCRTFDINCLSCKVNVNTLECTACKKGTDMEMWKDADNPQVNYFLDTNKCVECSNGCLSCENSSTCTTCQKGYRLQDKKCIKCLIKQCEMCTGTDGEQKCNKCFADHRVWMDTKVCEMCETGCVQCDTDRKRCDLCKSDWYMLNGKCKAMRQNCRIMETNGTCTHCVYGYRSVDGWCHPCSTMGYVYCNYGCESKMYTRDGDKLSEAFENSHSVGTIGNLITYTVAMFILILTFLL